MSGVGGTALRIATWMHRRVLRGLKAATVGVRVIALRGDGRIALVRHSYRDGWYLPGGGVEPGEAPADAALREAREEAGVVPSGVPLLFGAYHLALAGADDYPLVYLLRDVTAGPCASAEIAEVGWFAPDALPDGVTAGTRRRIAEWQGRRPIGSRW